MGELKLIPKPDLFEYDNYRKFLEDLYCYYKQTTRHFSYRYFSKRAGFASPNFLKLVIGGSRNLSYESVQRFIKALGLTAVEAEYFENLVYLNQAATPEEKSRFAERIRRSRAFKRIHPLKQAHYEYYAHWYHIPIREMVAWQGFQECPHWIAEQLHPPITPDQAARALRTLEDLGLLSRDNEGRLQQVHKTLNTDDEVTSGLIAGYHKTMMKKAADSIDSVERDRREIGAVCMSVSEQTANEIKKRLQSLREEILTLAAHDDGAHTVYQLNFQLFPLTSSSKRGGPK